MTAGALKDRKCLNMKTTKIVQLGILATIIAFAFPPVHYRNSSLQLFEQINIA